MSKIIGTASECEFKIPDQAIEIVLERVKGIEHLYSAWKTKFGTVSKHH
jgi:hypothetical protein